MFMLMRGDGLAQTMSAHLLDRIEHDTYITVYPHTVVAAVHGDRQLEAVVLENRLTGEHTDVRAHYLFAMIGGEPHTAWLDGTVQIAGRARTAAAMQGSGNDCLDYQPD